MYSEEVKINIPVVNLYYMMCYRYLDIRKMNTEDFKDNKSSPIENMLSSVLIQGITRLFDKGIYKEYTGVEGLLPILKGKIDIQETIRLKTRISRQVYCHYDEFSEDNIYNQILKAFCLMILKRGRVDIKFRKRAKKLMYSFCNVKDISLGEVSWGRLSYEKNKFHYKSLITVGYMIYKELYLNYETGRDWLEFNTLQKIYSDFIFNFYDKACRDVSVKYDRVTTDELGGTDFILQSKQGSMVIHTNLLDQLYEDTDALSDKTFLLSEINKVFNNIDNSKMGVITNKYLLLYPAKSESPIKEYKVNGNIIYMAKLDLSRSMEEIVESLRLVCKYI